MVQILIHLATKEVRLQGGKWINGNYKCLLKLLTKSKLDFSSNIYSYTWKI